MNRLIGISYSGFLCVALNFFQRDIPHDSFLLPFSAVLSFSPLEWEFVIKDDFVPSG
uniref:Uncharacterized protein n=1 Tax=Rhizophora mucronata TaxID=61149 RepID=A0A2P2P7C1_RHIMU